MASGQRPLSELSPVAQRRNSPSWISPNSKDIGAGDSSPFDSSPLNNSNSPRLFWKSRDNASPYRPNSENGSPYDPAIPMSQSKRSSIENLKRASRVKNSSLMFASENKQESDSSHTQARERPLASGRSLGFQFQRNSPTPADGDARRQLPSQMSASKAATEEQQTPRPFESPSRNSRVSGSPPKGQATPTKSSLSKSGRYSGKVYPFDPAHEIWSDEESAAVDESHLERSGHRHAKSVTFDAAPPQVNEYEMTTPVPSSIASSSREGSEDSYENEDDSFEDNSYMIDDSFDASLEDTDKTPVVLPEEWRFMSPGDGQDDALHGEDDPFYDDYDGVSDRDSTPGSVQEPQPLRPRLESMDSNGERRPLPPLPGATNAQESPDRDNSVLSAFERGSSSGGRYPSPLRPASCSKAELSGFGNSSMSLEDRLQLMMTTDRDDMSSEADRQRERRMRRMGAKERCAERDGDRGLSPMSGGSEREMSPDMFSTPPRISRESIMRDIKAEDTADHDVSNLSGSLRSPSPMPLDPDIPIPSRETEHGFVDDDICVKEEIEEIDLYDIPEYKASHTEQDNSLNRENQDGVDDDGSHYSRDHDQYDLQQADIHSDGRSTPVPRGNSKDEETSQSNERPASPSPVSNDEEKFDVDFLSYAERSISPLEGSSTIAPHFNMESIRNSLHRPETPENNGGDGEQSNHNDDRDTPPTPQSVIRHPRSESPEESNIPEPIATVKASVPGLKTKPSLTPADVETMAATRRKVSGQDEPTPPSIQEHSREDESTFIASEANKHMEEDDTITGPSLTTEEQPIPEQRQSSLVKLDIPVSTSDEGLGFGLDQEFDRVIEAEKVAFELSLSQHSYPSYQPTQQEQPSKGQSATHGITTSFQLSPTQNSHADNTPTKQRGYLMRQNTKVIVASSAPTDEPAAPGAEGTANARRANEIEPSPRKASQQTWTVEPWNGKSRRQSIKMAGVVPRKKVGTEPVPPLPGRESNMRDISGSGVRESDISPADDHEEGQERGRLFVKVVGVKNLDLPLPRNETSHFALTLDNGIHCVTTSWLELGKSAPIGQEFELVVLNDLEFQLTLQMKLEPPKPKAQSPQAKPQKSQKASAFSRVFASPKKRREMELRHQQEAEKQQKAAAMSQTSNIDPWEKLRKLAAEDGSFARSYVSLSDHEEHAFGRPLNVDITCFNEWAVDETVNSVKSKRGAPPTAGSGVQRLPPYHIGNLELQLLYVPKPKGATDEDMPKSMNACIREMREADNAATRNWEGFLSQQGGDCPYWRRRLFKLQGSKLTAYHEVTRQPRATINLAKAAKLIDDKSILTQRETTAKGGGRRKSAFAEEEEGYMFVEEGFRIRFGNGEVIDFYADSAYEKEGWMKVLGETVGKGYSAGSGKTRPWTELVLKRDKSTSAKKPAADRRMSKPARPNNQGPTSSAAPPRPPPPPPAKENMRSPPMGPPPKPRHQHHQSQPEAGVQGGARHHKTRSLIF